MECNVYEKNGLCSSKVPAWGDRVRFKFRAGGTSLLRVADAVLVSGGPSVDLVSKPASYRSDDPFMSSMDEITYWIYTKRAPCLMNYDNVIKKSSEEAHCSKTKPISVPSKAEVPSPKKKKKRKLSLLEDDSGSVEKLQNVYFDSSQNKKHTVMTSGKSESIGSDIDFNIRSHIRQAAKQKQSKLQKTSKIPPHKKTKVVTSTPKVSQLRRSVRQAQQTLNNNSQLNSSFQIITTSFINGHDQNHSVIEVKSPEKAEASTELLAGGDQTIENKKNTIFNNLNESKNEVLNRQFEDLSDVSGFTANYIRSTKLQSTKTPRKLRCKNNRNLVKESRQSAQKDCTMLVCADKSVNTGAQDTVHDCSTESENVINLVTSKSVERIAKVSKSTSLLKFIDSRPGKNCRTNKKQGGTRRSRTNLNVSFESQSSAPRYPKRHRNNSTIQDEVISEEANLARKKQNTSRNSTDFNNSDKKENPEAAMISRTRSGRSIGLSLRQPENMVLVLSNSTEQVSSMVSMNVGSSMVSLNVASPKAEPKEQKKKHTTSRYLRSKKMNDKSESLQRDSLRDKSGFTACFSDSDDDSEPLKHRKFFCA